MLESLLDQIAIDKETFDDRWGDDRKREFKKKETSEDQDIDTRIAFDETREASDDESDGHRDVVRTCVDV